MWLASAPSVRDFGCGRQPSWWAGTRSSSFRVLAASWSSSIRIGSIIFICVASLSVLPARGELCQNRSPAAPVRLAALLRQELVHQYDLGALAGFQEVDCHHRVAHLHPRPPPPPAQYPTPPQLHD